MNDTKTTSAVVIGTGKLTWPRSERVTDRYGTVMLLNHGDSLSEHHGYVQPELSTAGQFGALVAVVLETRESTHIGDLFRGFSPSTPDVGVEIVLGTGRLFSERRQPEGFVPVGLEPADGRQDDWLDPEALYRCHEQTVRLEFRPGGVS